MKRFAIVVFFGLAVAMPAIADLPVRREQFVYSIVAFNGRDYSGTFTTEDSDAIYLLAGQDSFLTARKAFVYFWPITADWRTDMQNLNQRFEGNLEIQDRSADRWELSSQRYTYYNVSGEYDLNWIVATGDDAEVARRRFQEVADEYRRQVQLHREALRDFEREQYELREIIAELRASGRQVDDLISDLAAMKGPDPPPAPKEYTVPPAPVERAFVLNLPVGEYRIRFNYTPDGDDEPRVMEGSEKRVIVFEARRRDHIGLDIVPGDRWTRPEESTTPSAVIYVNGSTDLYLRPFFQHEVNDLYYEKLNRNDAVGNRALMKWAQLQQVPRARIEVVRQDGEMNTVTEVPYLVEQVGGGMPGYVITPYNPEGAHAERDPSLRAFRIPIRPDDVVVRLEVTDHNGSPLLGGQRQIRVVDGARWINVLLVFVFSPFLVMLVVYRKRHRFLKTLS